jgi:HlyD family secretion protein
MTATVQVVTDERDNVLRVPDQALRYTPGGVTGTGGAADVRPVATSGRDRGAEPSTVWVLYEGRPAAVPVTVGLDDQTNAEIIHGALQPGDRVIVSEQGRASGQRTSASSGPRLRF